MLILILGVTLWWAAHVFKRVAPERRAALGERGAGLIAAVLGVSVLLMIIGYRMADTAYLWSRAGWATPVNNLLMVVSLYLVTPGPKKGALFYRMRHPMLTGFFVWTVAHLLVNGDSASLVLFGGLGLWALASMVIINRAAPEWAPNEKGAIGKDIMFFAIAILLTGIFGSIHALFGLTPFGG